MTNDRIARAARIVLRRALTADETTAIGAADNLGTLLPKLLALAPASALDDGDKAALAYAAVIDRYDPEPVSTAQHWRDLLALDDTNLPGLIGKFQDIAASGYVHDAAAAPVTAGQPIRTVAGADGSLVILAIGANRRLNLFMPDGASWTQHDLSAAIAAPVDGHVEAFDVRQDGTGAISIAIAVGPRRGASAAVIYTATGLSNAMDEAGWMAAVAAMKPAGGVPAGMGVSDLRLASTANGGTAILVGGTVAGAANTYQADLAQPDAAWTQIRIPEDATAVRGYALSTGGRSGLFTLYDIGGTTALIFTSVTDRYGKTINVSYTAMPTGATAFAIAADGAGTLPVVYVAGDALVCYAEGTHDAPATIATGKILAILAADSNSVRYADADGALWRAERQPDASWQTAKIADAIGGGTLVVAPPMQDGRERFLTLAADGVLSQKVIATDGTRAESEVPQRAVWAEAPLSPDRLKQAITAAAPMIRFHEAEAYLPSPVDTFLRKVGLWNEVAGSWTMPPGSLWDDQAGDLAAAAIVFGPRSSSDNPHRDCDFDLRIDDPDLTALQPGALAAAPMYVHAKFKPAENVTHLVFWLFYPYNGPGTLKLEALGSTQYSSLDPLGTHEGDWEHFTVEVDNDTLAPTQLYLSAHDSGAWKAIAELDKDGASGRHVVYISRNGHAAYVTTGDNPSHGQAGGSVWSFALVNQCGAGASLPGWDDGKTVLISAPCLGANQPAEPNWLRLPWRWGRYKPVTGDDMAKVIDAVLGSAVSSAPFGSELEQAIGQAIVSADVLGGEGYAAGPEAIKYKDNWFGAE
jgi:hypothetical protein